MFHFIDKKMNFKHSQLRHISFIISPKTVMIFFLNCQANYLQFITGEKHISDLKKKEMIIKRQIMGKPWSVSPIWSCYFLNRPPKTSIFYWKDLFIEEKKIIFSPFCWQILTHMVFCHENVQGIFSIKLPWIFSVMQPTMMSYFSCSLFLVKGCLCLI